MANIIKIKRGLSSDINSAVLELGELAITTDTNKLYVGSVSGVPQEVITISQEQVQAMIDQAIEDETTGLLHLQPTSWINRDMASNGKILSTNDNYQHLHDKTELWYRGEPQPYILDLDFTKHTVEDYVNAGIVELTYSTTAGLTYDDQGMHCTDTDLRNGLKLTNPIPVMQNWTIEMTMTLMPFEESGTSLTTVEYNNVMWFSTTTLEGHTHNSNCYAPAIFVNGGTAASSRLGDKIGTDLSVQNVYKMDGIEHTYKVTWDSEAETVAYYRDGEKIGQNTWPSTLTTSPGGELGYVLGAHMGYSSAKNFATQKGHIIKSILVYETGKKYNMSQATMYNPVDRDITITGAAGYTYKILGYKDNELHYESEIVEDVTPITYSISDLGDGTCDGMNVWFYGDAAQDLEVENIIQDIKVDYVEWYKDTTATLMAKQKTPMRVKAKSNLEYAIANYDETGAFINKTGWIVGDGIDHSYADNQYVNIAVRTRDEGKVFTADMLRDVEVQIIPDDYATIEYVDNAIANIDIPEVDFTGYATEDYVNAQINAIPEVDLSNYATTDYVNTSIQNIDIPETDLTPYSTTEEVKEMIEVATGDNFTGVLNQYPSMWIKQNSNAELTLANTEKGPLSVLVNAPALAHTKQLLDANNATIFKGYSNGINYLASNAHRIVYIPCEPSTTYTISGTTEGWISNGIYCSDAEPVANGTCSNTSATGVTENGRIYFTVTTNSTANYLAVMYYNANKTNAQTETEVLNDLMIGLGSDRTEYYPYQMSGIEYSIATYDGLNNFVSQSTWMQGDGIAHEYTSTGYLNIILRNMEGGEIDKDIALGKVYITVPVEEYATKEYVDSTFGKIHIGTEAPTDESVYCWMDTTLNNKTFFQIYNDIYYADRGMTWAQWVESSYNTIGMYIHSSDSSVKYANGPATYHLKACGDDIYSYETIISGLCYTYSVTATPV